jgi:hypothetical protein
MVGMASVLAAVRCLFDERPMSQLVSCSSKLESARRIARLLFAIGALGGVGVMVLEWLRVAGIKAFWLLVFLPVLLPSSAFLGLLNRHEQNCQFVARHLMHTSLLPPTFGQYVAACVADLTVVGMTVVLPVVLLIARTSEWASKGAAASEGSWIPWSLAMAAGWIILFAVPAYAYVLWLPTTRLGARPGFWLLGLSMVDLEGRRLARHAKSAIPPVDPDAEAEPPPAYLLVRRPVANKEGSSQKCIGLAPP